MRELNVFSLFCEDVRHEADGRSTFIGVCSGTIYMEPAETVDRLKAVCIARLPGEGPRTADVSISASVTLGDKIAKAQAYRGEFTRADDDNGFEWGLQLLLDLKGMPMGEGARAELVFEVNGMRSVAYVVITQDRKVLDRLGAMLPSIENKEGPVARRTRTATKPATKRKKAKITQG